MSSRRGPPGPPGLLGSVFAPGSASSRRKRPLGVAAPGVCRGSGTVSRHAVAGVGPRGGGGGGVASSGPPGWRPLSPTPAVPSPPPCVRGPCPLPGHTPRGSRPVGTGGSRPRPSARARPRPGDACLGGDPRDAAASARRCAPSPGLWPCRGSRPGAPAATAGAVAVAGAGGDRGRAVRPSPVRALGARACPGPLPGPLTRPPLRPSRGSRLVLPAPPRPLPLRPPAAAAAAAAADAAASSSRRGDG